jgi:hypothetical protein
MKHAIIHKTENVTGVIWGGGGVRKGKCLPNFFYLRKCFLVTRNCGESGGKGKEACVY